MKKIFIKTSIFIIVLFFILLATKSSNAAQISAQITKQDYRTGAILNITSTDTIYKVKLYKKSFNNKYILFYMANVNSNSIDCKISNSVLSSTSSTNIRIVVEDKDGRVSTLMNIDKIPAKPTATVAPTTTTYIPTATPVPSTTATSLPTVTSTSTPVHTATASPIPTPTLRPVPTPTSTATSTPIVTSTPVVTATPVVTTTPTATPTPTATSTPSPSPSSQPVVATPGTHLKEYSNLQYYEVIPDNPRENLPLIIFLHGSGERKKTSAVTGVPIFKYITSKKAYESGDFIFIAPYINTNYTWTSRSIVPNLINVIDKVAADYKVDTNRIVLTGMSLGGIGTWYIASKYPDKFAAIMPMSGYTSSVSYSNLKNIPIYAISGTGSNGDFESQCYTKMTEMVNKINKLGGHATREIIKGAQHNTIQKYYQRKKMFDWMLSKSKSYLEKTNNLL